MQNFEFERGKSQFIRNLKTDEDVQAVNSEAEIRALFDDLIEYVSLVNNVSYIRETKRGKNVRTSFDRIQAFTKGREDDDLSTTLEKASQGIQQLLEARRKPITPHIDDITDIAYTVGIAGKKNKAAALEVDIEENQQNQKELIKNGNMNGGFFYRGSPRRFVNLNFRSST